MNLHPIQSKLLKIAPKLNTKTMSLREIASLIEEKHPETVRYHLDQLERKGFVKWDKRDGSVRAVSPSTEKSDVALIPIYGYANAEEALAFADEHLQGYLRVSRGIVGKTKKLFAIQVIGTSMNRARVNGRSSIDPGDYVLVDPEKKDPANGDYVLSIIDGLANIKKFLLNKKEELIALISESTEKYEPIYIRPGDAYLINGIVVGVIKSSVFDDLHAIQQTSGKDILKAIGNISKEEDDYYHRKR